MSLRFASRFVFPITWLRRESLCDEEPPAYDEISQVATKVDVPVRENKRQYTQDYNKNGPITKQDDMGKINKRAVDQAITLLSMTIEENEAGNNEMAWGLYLTGVEKLLNAVPLETDEESRAALQRKLHSWLINNNMLSPHQPVNNSLSLSETIIQFAVRAAIALKQSPVPDAIAHTAGSIWTTIRLIESRYSVRERFWNTTRDMLGWCLDIGARHQVHRLLSDVVYTCTAVVVNAGVAYRDAPGYKEIRLKKQK
ncbi:uncharacterized protein VTP21DRAFT_6191 [Calcarisporiella thermophila]|uniref:uncharacterized protein n=1 Tax=Calcarisporiella thermophila TaxID=911321 RepID=UPI003742F970